MSLPPLMRRAIVQAVGVLSSGTTLCVIGSRSMSNGVPIAFPRRSAAWGNTVKVAQRRYSRNPMSLSSADEARRELARKATQGPWKFNPSRDESPLYSVDCPYDRKVGSEVGFTYTAHDAKCIAAHDPPTVLKLYERLERLRRWLKKATLLRQKPYSPPTTRPQRRC